MERRSFVCVACLLASAVVAAGCGPRPVVARDASGKPVFDPTKVRHPANEPYFCFKVVDARGDQQAPCEAIKDWCVRELKRATREGLTVLGSCHEVDQVSCYVAYSGGSSRSFCWEEPAQCAAMSATSEQQGAKASACESLDRTFQPAR